MIEANASAPDFNDPGIELLRQSMLSLSVTFFGKQHRQNQITRKGYTLYGDVLRQLNQHLTLPELQTTDETILTALTCMLLEIFLPTGPKNFFKHHRGLEAIMAMRGPPTNTTGDTATIFRGLRILSIIGALASSQPSIYARSEWKSAPPAADATAPMQLQHQFFTCLADCTSLIYERDLLLSGASPLWTYEPLLSRVHATLSDLTALHPLYVRFNASQLPSSRPPSPLAVELGVANHFSATALMLYNTVYITLLQLLDSLAPSPSNTSLRNEAAATIAKCLELKEAEKRAGAHESNTIGFVATKIAWQALGGFDSPEGRRLAKTVSTHLNGVTPLAVGDREAWDSARPEDVRDTVFARFMERVPDGTLVDRARGMDLSKLPEANDIGYNNTAQTRQS
ncbi:hypothetical protein N0V86_007545 [Didymella sp. IMI 355093]|nr:hypothetical protein N0V86_007545 [Didymella sp. IMI 355093]